MVVQSLLCIHVAVTLISQDTDSCADTLNYLLWQESIHDLVRRKFRDLLFLQELKRVVRGLELTSSSFLGDGEELVPGDSIANDERFFFPSRQSKKRGD